MAKRNTSTPTSPKQSPKTEPKAESRRTPKKAPDAEPNGAPKQRPAKPPKPAPIKAPVTTPETSRISIYSLPFWDSDHSTSPHCYGNNGKAIGEFHTEGDAKEWLRNNERFGHFAAVERINGRIGKSWHIEIEPLEVEPENDLEWLEDDDLEDAQLLNPDVVRAKIENAKLKAELKALSQNGGQSSIASLLEGIKMLDEMRGQANPQKSLVEQLREVKEIYEFANPRREPSVPAPRQPEPFDPEVAVINMLAKNDESLMTRLSKGLVGKLLGDKAAEEPEPWYAELAKDIIKSGQAPLIARELMSGLGSLFTPFLPKPAMQPAQPPIAGQTPMSATLQTPTQTPALNTPEPTAPQFGGQSQDEIAAMVAVRRLIGRILPAMQMNTDPIPIVTLLISHCDVLPEHEPLIQAWMEAPAESLLLLLNQNVPEAQQITSLPHALEWTQKLQAAYLTDEEEPEEHLTEKGAQDGTTNPQ
ncbi:MAG TPA: hypothetical protein PLQ88_26675 [Blastocatellia bacterium]|nr:hypothetical protein [Blastocatellia bacterium]